MNNELQPYYLDEGKRLLDVLLSIGLVGVDTENDYNAISEFLGGELQDVANTAMRRATMKLRREQLLAQQQEPKPYTEFKDLRGIGKEVPVIDSAEDLTKYQRRNRSGGGG